MPEDPQSRMQSGFRVEIGWIEPGIRQEFHQIKECPLSGLEVGQSSVSRVLSSTFKSWAKEKKKQNPVEHFSSV